MLVLRLVTPDAPEEQIESVEMRMRVRASSKQKLEHLVIRKGQHPLIACARMCCSDLCARLRAKERIPSNTLACVRAVGAQASCAANRRSLPTAVWSQPRPQSALPSESQHGRGAQPVAGAAQ